MNELLESEVGLKITEAESELAEFPLITNTQQITPEIRYKNKYLRMTMQPIDIDPEIAEQHYHKLIGGVNVITPMKLYEPQVEYTKKLMEAITQGRNAMLEMPTGTGKTLAFTCGAIALE